MAITLVLYFAGKYANPALFEDVKVGILAMQPVFVSIILAIAVEDSAAMKAGISYVGTKALPKK